MAMNMNPGQWQQFQDFMRFQELQQQQHQQSAQSSSAPPPSSQHSSTVNSNPFSSFAPSSSQALLPSAPIISQQPHPSAAPPPSSQANTTSMSAPPSVPPISAYQSPRIGLPISPYGHPSASTASTSSGVGYNTISGSSNPPLTSSNLANTIPASQVPGPSSGGAPPAFAGMGSMGLTLREQVNHNRMHSSSTTIPRGPTLQRKRKRGQAVDRPRMPDQEKKFAMSDCFYGSPDDPNTSLCRLRFDIWPPQPEKVSCSIL